LTFGRHETKDLKTNQTLVKLRPKEVFDYRKLHPSAPLCLKAGGQSRNDFTHQENDYIDFFSTEISLPVKAAQKTHKDT
jgi:hypothetical protein